MTRYDRLAVVLCEAVHRPDTDEPDWTPCPDHEMQAQALAADPTLVCPDPADHALADAMRRHKVAVLGALRTAMVSLPIEVKATPYTAALAAITAALEDKP